MTERIALVTGAGSGIGKAIAEDLAREQFNIGLLGRDEIALQEVQKICESYGVTARCYPVDLRDANACDHVVEQMEQDFGGLTVLINNAGVWIEKDIEDASLEEWDQTFDVNVRALFALTKAALPLLKEAEQGVVINISSQAAHRSYAGGTLYAASKHAVQGFSNSLFQDVREHGIKVSAISPGYVNTRLHEDNDRLDETKMIQPEDIASAVRFVISFPESACPTEITIVPQHNPKQST